VVIDVRLCICRYVYGFWWERRGWRYKGRVSLSILFWVFWYCWIVLPHWWRASNGGKKWGMYDYFCLPYVVFPTSLQGLQYWVSDKLLISSSRKAFVHSSAYISLFISYRWNQHYFTMLTFEKSDFFCVVREMNSFFFLDYDISVCRYVQFVHWGWGLIWLLT